MDAVAGETSRCWSAGLRLRQQVRHRPLALPLIRRRCHGHADLGVFVDEGGDLLAGRDFQVVAAFQQAERAEQHGEGDGGAHGALAFAALAGAQFDALVADADVVKAHVELAGAAHEAAFVGADHFAAPGIAAGDLHAIDVEAVGQRDVEDVAFGGGGRAELLLELHGHLGALAQQNGLGFLRMSGAGSSEKRGRDGGRGGVLEFHDVPLPNLELVGRGGSRPALMVKLVGQPTNFSEDSQMDDEIEPGAA